MRCLNRGPSAAHQFKKETLGHKRHLILARNAMCKLESKSNHNLRVSFSKKRWSMRTLFADNDNFFEVGIILRDYVISDYFMKQWIWWSWNISCCILFTLLFELFLAKIFKKFLMVNESINFATIIMCLVVYIFWWSKDAFSV